MFERYTEKARRVVFFAQYEASQFGSPDIEAEHLLLGLLREDKTLTNRFLRSHASVESIRKQVEGHTTIRGKTSASVGLPLSNESKRVLAYAAEESERLWHKHIGTEHLLLGLLREERSFAASLLGERGLVLSEVREELTHLPHRQATVVPGPPTQAIASYARDLSAAAGNGELLPVAGREQEIDAVIKVLSCPAKQNPVLIGERRVGKSAIVHGAVARIVLKQAPSGVWEKRVWALDLPAFAVDVKYRGEFLIVLRALLQELAADDSVLCIPNVERLLGGASEEKRSEAATMLEVAVSRGRVQLVFETTPGGYEQIIAKYAWFARCSQRVRVLPVSEDTLLGLLRIVKEDLSKRHRIAYADAGIDFVAHHCGGHVGKAVDALEAAAWRAKSRMFSLQGELADALQRIRSFDHCMEDAVANHEFEKARTYLDELSKRRGALRDLYEKYQISESATETVQSEDAEYVLSRWNE